MENKNLWMAKKLAACVKERGGSVYFVGGFVRDLLMGHDNKDVDIEVHGVEPKVLEEILDSLGKRTEMGISFGVYGLRGYDLDIAMPRQEKATGRGHRDFQVYVDPFLGTYKAAMRRDFTMNAMMQDVLTGEIIDHFHGQEDLKKGIFRHVNTETFVEDPLRVLRGAQFAARFGFSLAEETIALAKTMDLTTLAKERILGELEKALLKAEHPSIFFEEMWKMEQMKDWFFEVSQLRGVRQPEKYHPEGDVWTHTMLVLDEAAKLRDQAENPLGLMLAALTHDFGKVVATSQIDGEIHAYGHEIKGLPMVKDFLKKITSEVKLLRYVPNLVELHQQPMQMAQENASQKSMNHLYDRAISPKDLLLLAKADWLGRGSAKPLPEAEAFLQECLEVFHETMAKPCVMGADLIAAGLKPGPEFSEFLAYAHKLRLADVEKESALKQTLAYARQKGQE